jgi:transmembrane sensor
MEDSKLPEEAAEWLMRLSDDGSAACRSDFQAWFQQSPRHVQEFLQATEMARALKGLDPKRSIDVQTLIGEAATNVVALGQHSERSHSKASTRRSLAIAAALAAAAVIAAATYFNRHSKEPAAFATAIGEQRTIKLEDGSLLTLNTRSRIAVQFHEHARDIRLLEGEALFAVIHDAKRPFRVLTHDATIQAIGTQFDVHRGARGTTVSVMEGAVQVSRASGTAEPGARLSAGEEARVTNGGELIKRALPNPATAVAWRERRLEFHDIALADVAAEFNRYNALQIRIEGPMDADKRLTGIFNADSPEALIRFLQRDRSLAVERRAGGLVIRER